MSLTDEKKINIIGKGSFGDVYLVIKNGCELARKDIKANVADMENVKHEIDLLKTLRDRNIVIYKDDYYDDRIGIYYIYTEYFENGDLFNIIKKQRQCNEDFNERV